MDGTQSGQVAAGVGVIAAGVGVASAGLAWPPVVDVGGEVELVAAALGAIAFVAFVFLHRGVVDRVPAAVVAALASAGLVGYALYAGYHFPAQQASLLDGMNVAATGGGVGVVTAFAAYRDVSRRELREMARAMAFSGLVGIAGFVSIYVVALAILAVLAVVDVSVSPILGNALSTLALGIGMGATAFLVLEWTGVGLEWIDVDVPSLRDIAYAVGGVIGLFVALIGVSMLLSSLGIESGQHAVVEQAQGDPAILLVLIPASYVFVGPGEELLFRNVIQKRLHVHYDVFTGPAAVVVASAVFGAVHFPAYGWDPVSVVIVFVLSLVLGTLYLLTENLLVPVFVHGTFNAIQFLVLYLQLTGSG